MELQEFVQRHMRNLCANVTLSLGLLSELTRHGIITEADKSDIINDRSLEQRAIKLFKAAGQRPEKLTQFVKILDKYSLKGPASILSTFSPGQATRLTATVVSEISTSAVSKLRPSSETTSLTGQDKPSIPPYKLKLTRDHLQVVHPSQSQSNHSGSRTGHDARAISTSDPSSGSTGAKYTVDKEVEALFDKFSRQPQGLRYPSRSKCKGLALLVNIVRFHDPRSYREGALLDTENLFQVLDDFGYDVYDVMDATKMQLLVAIEDFRNLFKTNEVDSCVICVMSHGLDENTIYASDGGKFHLLSDLVEKFNNVNCPSLEGIPKIFFFQFCRGDATDLGVPPARDSMPANPVEPVRTIPSWTDMLVCYSTLDGHYAYRDKDKGSWFVQSLCEVLRRYGREYDICKLLNLVSEVMKIRVGGTGEKQICPYYNVGFSRIFDFRSYT